MKYLLLPFLFLIPLSAPAKETLRKYRWSSAANTGIAQLFTVMGEGSLTPQAKLLPGTDESIQTGPQTIGPARVAGTWSQTILGANGKVVYSSGEAYDSLPIFSITALEQMKSGENMAVASAKNLSYRLKNAIQIFPATLEIRQKRDGSWETYWKITYLNAEADQIRYTLVNSMGMILEEGDLHVSSVDGLANVFPRGPKLSVLTEDRLRNLSGDGTLNGKYLNVTSALDLRVWAPDLNFLFPTTDRRFDMTQAYYTIEEGFQWMKDHLGVELPQPVTVRLHVGDGGISNAAFYHQNSIFLGTGDGVLYHDMVRDPTVLVHESMHALIDTYAGLPSEGEGGGLNEGFADLFTGLILDNPRMGEVSYMKAPYRRTIENTLKAYRDFNSSVYNNGSILAGTFWDIKLLLGNEKTAQLAFRTLVRLGAGAKFDDVGPAILSATTDFLPNDQLQTVMQAVRERGWKVDP